MYSIGRKLAELRVGMPGNVDISRFVGTSVPFISTTILALARNSRSSFIARVSGVFPDISGFAVFRIYHVQTYPDHVQTHEKTDNLLDTFS